MKIILLTRILCPLLLAGLLLMAAHGASEAGEPPPSAPGRAQSVSLDGLSVRLGPPIQVTAQIAWKTSWLNPNGEERTGYLHFFPLLAKFPGGNLLATYSLDPDAMDNPVFISGYQISADGGKRWGRRYSVLTYHPATFLPVGPNSLLGLTFNLLPRSPGDTRNFVGPTYLFEDGGRTVVTVPEGMQVDNWPWAVDAEAGSQPGDNWPARFSVGGSVLPFHGGFLATAYFRQHGEHLYHTVILFSSDGGHHWSYYATVAGPDPALAAVKGYEGPNESAMVQLADGGLMAVFRVGSGRKWNLRRNYSRDDGRTWTAPEPIPAYSVFPQLLRTANGTIVLSTGRPGLDLWLAADPQARKWQKIDLVTVHNRWATDASTRIELFPSGDGEKSETTSYTSMVETEPNHILLIYDRDPVIRPPERPPANPKDLSRVYLLSIEIERR